jgi:hypothetical protein
VATGGRFIVTVDWGAAPLRPATASRTAPATAIVIAAPAIAPFRSSLILIGFRQAFEPKADVSWEYG